jgi:hypothetical protein
MTSPGRFSVRCSDSSISVAKDYYMYFRAHKQVSAGTIAKRF